MSLNKHQLKERFLNYTVAGYAVVILFLLLGLIFQSGYGATWDEKDQHILSSATLQYFETQKSGAIELKEYPTLRHYGPSIPLMIHLVSGIARSTTNLPVVDASHLFILFLGGVTLVSTFWIGRALFSARVGFYSVLFLALFPRFIAHAHYNPKDIPLAAVITLTFFLLIKTWQTHQLRYALAAGVVYGIGLSTVVSVLVALPIYGLSYLLYLFVEDKITKKKDKWKHIVRSLGLMFTGLGLAGVVMYATWPLMWVEPTIFIDAVNLFREHKWNAKVLYMGDLVFAHDLPQHYAPVWLFLTTPVLTIVAMVFGTVASGVQIKQKKSLFAIGTLCIWMLVPLVLFMRDSATNYDGIRHFFFFIPPMMILAALGVDWLYDFLRKKTVSQKIVACVFVVAALWMVVEVVRVHPYQGSYMNEAFRVAVQDDAEELFELEYWGVVYREGVEWLNDNAKKKATICTPMAPHLPEGYKRRKDLKLGCGGEYDYVMVMTRGGEGKRPEQSKGHGEPVFTIERQNAEYLRIYEVQ